MEHEPEIDREMLGGEGLGGHEAVRAC